MASFDGGMGVSFQAANHLSGDFWDGTKFRHYYGASPTAQGGMKDGPACACPVTDVQAMGALRTIGLILVAVLKRDPHAPVTGPTGEEPRCSR